MDTLRLKLHDYDWKELSIFIMNSRKYNPEILFLFYYPFHVTSFQR